MLTAPQQNWSLYESKCRSAHVAWLRGLSPESAWELHQSLFAAAMSHGALPLPPELAQSRWQEKLAIRRRQVAAFARRDQRLHDRCTENCVRDDS